MAKFRKGQLVVLVKAYSDDAKIGAVAEVVAAPHQEHWFSNRDSHIGLYVINIPGMQFGSAGHCEWYAYEHQLRPLRDDDNRTAEYGELVFNPKTVEV